MLNTVFFSFREVLAFFHVAGGVEAKAFVNYARAGLLTIPLTIENVLDPNVFNGATLSEQLHVSRAEHVELLLETRDKVKAVIVDSKRALTTNGASWVCPANLNFEKRFKTLPDPRKRKRFSTIYAPKLAQHTLASSQDLLRNPRIRGSKSTKQLSLRPQRQKVCVPFKQQLCVFKLTCGWYITAVEEFDRQIKLVVVGESGVGKSSLIARYNERTFSQQFNPSVGVSNKSKLADIGPIRVKLQAFDTAGREQFRDFTLTSFKDADVAFIVFSVDSRESFDR